MKWLALVLIGVISASSVSASENDFELTEAEQKASCGLTFVPSAVEESLIRESFNEVVKQKNWIQKPLAGLFAKKIRRRVLNLCIDPEQCTPENILKVTDSETQKVLGSVRSVSGYFVLAGMQASVYALMFQITKSAGGSVAATIIANSLFGRFTDHFQSPINFMIDPVVRRFSQKMVANGVAAPDKEIDSRLVNKAQLVKETYTDAERDGMGQILGPQNDQGSKVKMIQGYFESQRAPESLTPEEQDALARMMGVQLFEQRRYHAQLAPTDPEYNALFIPYLRPLAKWFQHPAIQGKIWGVVHLLEMESARLHGEKSYDKKAAQKYYTALAFEWFEKPLPKIVPRNSL